MLSALEYVDWSQIDFSQACRLFHGRGHAYENLSHLCIDWLSPIVLITLYQAETDSSVTALAQALADKIPLAQSVQVQYRYEKNAPIEVVLGEDLPETVVNEAGLDYQITLGRAQNTGLFLDMRLGRQWVRQHAQDASVLNLFSYTCAFSVAATAGGAKQVLNVDMSRASLTMGRHNHRINGQQTDNVYFQAVDIFKSFGRLKKYGPYDLLVCDPPTFQKGSVDIKRDYKKIIRRLPAFMKPNSWVMLCLNAPDLDEAFLHQTVADECPDCVYVESLSAPAVFVESMAGRGLKIALYRYQPR